MIRELIADEARAKIDDAASWAGIEDERDPRYAELLEHDEAARFAAIATGQMMRLDERLEEYLAIVGNDAKTIDMKRYDEFCTIT